MGSLLANQTVPLHTQRQPGAEVSPSAGLYIHIVSLEEDEETSNRQQSESAIRAGLRIVLGAEDAEVVACEVLEGLSETQCARLLRRSGRTVRASQQRGMARRREVVPARA